MVSRWAGRGPAGAAWRRPTRAFLMWQKAPENARLDWDVAMRKYGLKLKAEGLTPTGIKKTFNVISARDEATIYDPVFAARSTRPTRSSISAPSAAACFFADSMPVFVFSF